MPSDARVECVAVGTQDAHACRLKISLVTANSEITCPWDLSYEMLQYVSKMSSVSAACRLR